MFDLETFRATKKPCDDKFWADLVEAGVLADNPGMTQDACLIYADGYMIHKDGEQFMVHAWWYSPIGYSTLKEAEDKLYPWYCEFAS